MDNATRRTACIASAILLSAPSVGGQSFSRRRNRSTMSKVSSGPSKHSDDVALVPTFSCGSIWTEATQCSQLCITGDGCPSGQQCYAGIPCPQDQVEEKQREAEAAEIEARVNKMQTEFVTQFVCGESYERAAALCSSSSSETHFCTSGLSTQCPLGMECFAAVSCPTENVASSEVEISPLSFPTENWKGHNLSSFVTEPILLNSTVFNENFSVGHGGSPSILSHGSCTS